MGEQAVRSIRDLVTNDGEQAAEFLEAAESDSTGLTGAQVIEIVRHLGPIPRNLEILRRIAKRDPSAEAAAMSVAAGWSPETGALDLAFEILKDGGTPAQSAALGMLGRYLDDPRTVPELDRLMKLETKHGDLRTGAMALRYSAEGVRAAAALGDGPTVEDHPRMFYPAGVTVGAPPREDSVPSTAGVSYPTPSVSGEGHVESAIPEVDPVATAAQPAGASDGVPDYDGILTEASATIARGVPSALVPQTRDVKARMKQLADDGNQDGSVREAAHTAEAALDTVLALLDGDIDAQSARPTLRGLRATVVEIIDLAQGGLIVVDAEVAAYFHFIRMALAFAGRHWRIPGLSDDDTD